MSPRNRRTAQRWVRRPEARAPELLEAALHVFAELGYRGTTLDAIADRAGVTKGTFYHYFDTKEALFLAVVAHYQAIAFERIEEVLRDKRLAAPERLSAVVRGTFTSGHRGARPLLAVLIRSLATELPRAHERWLRDGPLRLAAILAGVIRRGQRAGEFTGALDAVATARQFVAGILLQLMWSQHGAVVPELATDERAIVEDALAGLLSSLRP